MIQLRCILYEADIVNICCSSLSLLFSIAHYKLCILGISFVGGRALYIHMFLQTALSSGLNRSVGRSGESARL